MFGGKEPYIYTGEDEAYDKYDLTADDLAVLISPTKSPGQPMVSPHASYGSDPQGSAGSSSVENFFFDINDLPSLGSEDQHFFGNSPAILQRDQTQEASRPPVADAPAMQPPLPHHPKMPGSKDKKKSSKPKRKSVFSFDLNEVNKFSNGQVTPVIKTEGPMQGAPAAAIPVTAPGGCTAGGASHHQQTASLTDSYISFNLGVTPSDAGTLPSLSSLGYAATNTSEPPTSAFFQDASVILNKPPSHRSRNSSANSSGQQKSFSPSELQDLSGNGELREPKGLHVRGRAMGITPLHTDQINSSAGGVGYFSSPQQQSQYPQQHQQQQQYPQNQQHGGVHPNYVTAYRSPKNVLDALTAEDIADLEFLRIDFSDPSPEAQSEEYYYSSEANTGGSASSAGFSPDLRNNQNNVYFGLNMSTVMGPNRVQPHHHQQQQQQHHQANSSSSSGPPSAGSGTRRGGRIKAEPELRGDTGSGKSTGSGRGRKSSSNTPQPLTPPTPVDEEKTSKSLSAISRRFIEFYGGVSTIDYISGLCNPEDYDDIPEQVARVDGAAETLGVHVRRIYELIKILEILSLVTFSGGKRGKFTWRGTKFFMLTLGSMQSEGMLKYPEVAAMSGLKQMEYSIPAPLPAVPNLRATFKKDNSLQDDALSIPHDAALPAGTFDLPGDFGAQSLRSSNNSLKGLDHPVEPSHTNPIGLLNDSDFESGDELLGQYHTGVAELTDLTSTDFSAGGVGMGGGADVTYISGYSSAPGTAAAAPGVGAVGEGSVGKPPTAKALNRAASNGSVTGEHEDVMMESICKSFLQLFLVGLDGISMGYAIQQIIPKDDNQTLQEYNKKNATKIRRVYDVANVLCSVNLIKKQSQMSKFKKPEAKSDSKALMWSSFPPLVVRDYYLRHSHLQRSARDLLQQDDD